MYIMRRSQLFPLTGLRFWLAFWVIVYHQSDNLISTYGLSKSVFNVLRTGHVAVGIFFVLSGFILSYNYDLGGWSKALTAKFAIARFARIYPVYLLGILLLAPFWIKAVLRAPWKELSLGASQLGLLQAWVPAATGIWLWNSPGWSVSNEAFFYLLFPSIGVVVWKFSHRIKTSVLLICLCWAAVVAVPLFSVLLSVHGCNVMSTSDEHQIFALDLIRFDPLLRLPEFLSGILACRLYLLLKAGWEGKGYWLYLPAFAASLLVIVMAADKVPYIILTNGLLLPATTIFIVGLALGGGLMARVLSFRSIVFLGNASYSMYLLHAPIRIWMVKWHVPGLSTIYGCSGYVCVVIVISSIVFRFMEEPLNAMIRNAWGRGRSPAPSIIVSSRTKPPEAVGVSA